jgi:FkbM family methyltransferase
MSSPAVYAQFRPWQGEVEPGWTVNWLGVRTRVSVQGPGEGATEPTSVRSEPPALSEDTFEWIDVLETVADAGNRYTMIELGAGWGRWLVNAAAALRQLDAEKPFLLVGVEAEPTHFTWLRQHLVDNDVDPEQHVLVKAAVAGRGGRVRFQHGDPAAWYGQAIERSDPAAKLAGPVSRLIRWSRNEGSNRLAIGRDARRVRRVRAVSLMTLLEPLDLVDLVDADVQGVEADVFEPAAEQLAAKVRRVHVGTHDRDNESRLRALFGGLGWQCRFDYPTGTVCETDWGVVEFEDGVQSWLNPALTPRA